MRCEKLSGKGATHLLAFGSQIGHDCKMARTRRQVFEKLAAECKLAQLLLLLFDEKFRVSSLIRSSQGIEESTSAFFLYDATFQLVNTQVAGDVFKRM